MADWPIGLSTGCFYRTKIFDVLDMIRDSGISVLEICSSREHLDYHDSGAIEGAARAIEERGLEPFSFHAPFGPSIDISAVSDEQRSRSLDDVRTAVGAAGVLKTRYFVLHPGPEESRRPPAEEYLTRLSNAAQSLEAIAEACREQSMLLVLENMLPHLLFGKLPDLFWMLGAIRARNIGTCLDTGHAFLAGDLDEVVHKLAAHLRMVHAADNRGEHDDHLAPGKGKIDWERVIGALSDEGFNGPIILELSGEDGQDPRGRLAEAVEARQYLREVCRRQSGCS